MNSPVPPSDRTIAQALQEERDFISTVIDSLPGIFYHFSDDGRLLHWNQNFEQVVGYNAEELTQMRPMDFFPGEERLLIASDISKIFETGRSSIEAHLIYKDGRRVPYLFTSVYFAQDGRRGFIGLALDLSVQKETERRLQQERDYSEAILNSLPGIFFHHDSAGKLLHGNQNLATLSGYTLEEHKKLGLTPLDFFEGEDRERLIDGMKAVFEQGRHTMEATYITKDGRRIPYFFNVVKFEYNNQPSFLGVGFDISESKRLQDRLQQERDYFDAALNSLPGVFYHYDEHGRLLRGNRNLERISGYTMEDRKTMGPLDVFAEEDRPHIAATIKEVMENGQAQVEANYLLKDGTQIPFLFTGRKFEYNGQLGFIGVGLDIPQRRQAEQMVQYFATHDALTGLANHVMLQERLVRGIAEAQNAGAQVALIYLDLDRFKVINDGYGHPFGDAVLKVIGKQLTALLPEADTIARQGGDEFLILLTDLQQADDAYAVARKIVENFRHPLIVHGRELYLSASIGVAMFPQDGDDADALLGNADAAMYHAKHLGRDTYQFFTQKMSEDGQRRILMETLLRNAIPAQQLNLVYQPKVNLENGRICGCEALLRWHHPQIGDVSPERFISIAEDSGLIMPIGNWVLRTACQQAKSWLDAGLPPTCIAVNVSARQFLQQDVVAWVLRTLEETGLPPEFLELELTESLVARDVEKVIATFRELKELGVKLSIDDFGTGYSSLNYLKHFRVDRLKIDKSFVSNMLEQTEDASIVLTIIDLAHNLNFKVIAEGVENERQCNFLRSIRCHEIQGHYFSRPVQAEAFGALLHSDKRLMA